MRQISDIKVCIRILACTRGYIRKSLNGFWIRHKEGNSASWVSSEIIEEYEDLFVWIPSFLSYSLKPYEDLPEWAQFCYLEGMMENKS